MSISEEEFRRIGTRDITLAREQMERLGIRKIYNSCRDTEYLCIKDAQQMKCSFNSQGEFCLLELARAGKLFKFSLIIFEDIWSRDVFALRNMNYYEGCPDLITLNN